MLVGGYLLAWTAAGLLAYAVVAVGGDALGGGLAWGGGGRWLCAGGLAIGAAYQLAPLKRACLARCRGRLEGGSGERTENTWPPQLSQAC